MIKYIPTIGLEVHIEPNTVTKMFCGCPQDYFGKKPNTQTCPICLGLPGALPFANKEAIYKTVKLGLGLGSKISGFSRFYRKHYFYPDLPKAFQTSQKDDPLCIGGSLLGNGLNHIHLEEDAGKLLHEKIGDNNYSLIDFNRSGCALIEIVTEPVFHDISDVLVFVKELQLVARYLDISGCDMEKGTMRLEANVSMSSGPELADYKVELKNINSFRFLEKALRSEIERQEAALNNGEVLIQETRGYDEVKQMTYSQRTKEASQDYRYFPEPDLPPIELSREIINSLKISIPELPNQKRIRFAKDYKLSKEFIEILVSDFDRADYFDKALKIAEGKISDPERTIATAMINKKLDINYPEPAGLVKKLIEITETEFVGEDEIKKAISQIISDNVKAVTDFKAGKAPVLGFLVGQTQKVLKGKGNPKVIKDLIEKKLNA